MSSARRRGRPAPLRWSGVVALVGVGVLGTGAYLQFGGDERAGAAPSSAGPPTSTLPAASAVPTPTAALGKPGGAAVPKPSTSPKSTSPKSSTSRTAPARAGKPTGISIPQLGVTAPVLAIDAVRAALTPPSDASKVGWWSAGAQPGSKRGSAVITGHTVHNGGGAFDNLDKLVPGSTVRVSTSRGQVQYRVATVTTYRKATLAKRAAQLFDQSVRGRLVLVTCEDWNGEIYLSNVVVVALPMA
ncbi:class F sortase [Kribbella sindirgiensis]|uniref:Class F sortase n=1 Tax=Kribbella sindirgiensis TaxID=1124744 RepID=A0A4R0IJH7_9ACTN|nr:class F sortase [Kribbella sindirgiensis]TCC32324.1 class F sortase [Kribbella sindirgiensis]